MDRIDLDIENTLRALTNGDIEWTLHRACEYGSDPGQWGASLVNDAEIMLACLDAAKASSVAEVGAYHGDLTRLLAERADQFDPSGGRVIAIDPSPQIELVELAERRDNVELIRETSLEALPRMELPDAIIVDGDHNYYTVSEELRLIGERARDAPLPVLLFHDVLWPHARRDDYFAPDLIPEEHRQRTHRNGGLFPGVKGVHRGGLPFRWPAAEEGGPRNGVLTAIEEFVDGQEGLRLAVVPAFFGLGVAWHREAPYDDALTNVVQPFDRNPLLARLEANRVFHLASVHYQMVQATAAREQVARQEAVLRRLLDSSAFSVAELLSRLRRRVGIGTNSTTVSKDEVRRAVAAD